MKRLWEIKYNNSQVFTIDGKTSRLKTLNAFIKFTNDNNIKIDNIHSIRNIMVKDLEKVQPSDSRDAFTYIYSCGSCDYTLDIPQLKEINFCPKCGQKLWWIEE